MDRADFASSRSAGSSVNSNRIKSSTLRLGASTTVDSPSAAVVARSVPDGYTIMIGSSGNLAVAPALLLVTSDGDETVRPKNANNLGAKLKSLGARVEVKNYGPLDHEEVVMALSVPFRGKGPVLADSVAFLKAKLGE